MSNIVDFNEYKKREENDGIEDINQCLETLRYFNNYMCNIIDSDEVNKDTIEFYNGFKNQLIQNYMNLVRHIAVSNNKELTNYVLEDLKFVIDTLPIDDIFNKKL